MSNASYVAAGQKALISNYARKPQVMVRGQGSWVWDADNKKYLDLFCGFGGSILGHCQPDLVKAAQAQATELWHVGNVFYNLPQIELAERIQAAAFPGRAFFCHSGAEANEAACKLARLRGAAQSPKRWKILSLHRSFHGRTMAMISATGNPKVKVGFEPLVTGFSQIEGGSIQAVENAVDAETCGIILEPIQGEGGINEYPAGYIASLRDLCTRKGITLIFDEVWTGCGRTGKWFGYQHVVDAQGKPIAPDIMTVGKAIGGGLPMGVMYATESLAALLVPGTHGCTLGGNAICAAVARAIFDVVKRDNLLAHATRLEGVARQRLASLGSLITGVRGKGLMLGIELAQVDAGLIDRCIEKGLLINVTAEKVIRLAPALNITDDEWAQGLGILCDCIRSR